MLYLSILQIPVMFHRLNTLRTLFDAFLLKFGVILIMRWQLFLSLLRNTVAKQRNFILFAAEVVILQGFSAIHEVLHSKLKMQRMLQAIKMSGRIKQAEFNYLN